jgi:aromatic-L-amino-acid/L-tryptophan decarboxylase
MAPDEPINRTRDLLRDLPMPDSGNPAEAVLEEAMELVVQHSVLPGASALLGLHQRGRRRGSGAFGDLLAAAVNPNVASWNTAATASAIEAQAIRRIAEHRSNTRVGPVKKASFHSG